MNSILGIIGLSLEILYYSLFLKLSKKEGNFLKYILSFVIISFILVIIGSNILSYFVFIIMTVLALKYIVKAKTKSFDMLFIFIMMILKIIIEGISVTILSNFIKNNYIMAISLGVIKLFIIFLFKNKLNLLYNKFEKYWNNNVFYIRYIFTILMLVYAISSCYFLIFNR